MTWHGFGVPLSVYNWICWSSSSARCCFGLGVVTTLKVGASGPALGVRQVLRTMVESSASKVAKLCAGVPSSRACRETLASAAAERLADLSAYRRDLQAVLASTAPSERWSDVFSALGASMRAHQLPAQPLHALLDAFEQDVRNPHYDNRASLLAYCKLSANPVGRLLLHLYGITDGTHLQHADAICSALQLINFWQDLSVDGPRGRHYVPQADLVQHGVQTDALQHGADSPASRAMVQDLCGWAHGLMLQGAPLALQVPGRAGWELRLVVQGGLRILEKIARMNHDVLSQRPRLTAIDMPLLLWRAVCMPAALR